MWYSFRPYVPVAKRRAQAAREVEKRRKKGQAISPVVIEGRAIAHTFWGKAWCDNLESYSDYENRLPRGRTYVRNGSVVDLQIQPGQVMALVSGSELYTVKVTIAPLPKAQWLALKSRCAGQIGSVVELLQGKLSEGVIGLVTSHDGGLFPRPNEIKMSCSCPDWAGMCKHVAAVLYGVGARLDHQPELLFKLRQVDHLELIEEAVSGVGKETATKKKTLAAADVAGVFGIELAEPEAAPTKPKRGKAAAPRQSPKPRKRKTKSGESATGARPTQAAVLAQTQGSRITANTVKFGDLLGLLEGLGFDCTRRAEGRVICEHRPSDTTVFLAERPAAQKVREQVLFGVRIQLDQRGLMGRDEFDQRIADLAAQRREQRVRRRERAKA